jgi:hypothetical protein
MMQKLINAIFFTKAVVPFAKRMEISMLKG